MVKEAEDFASEDEAQRKHIDALSSLSSFVSGPKTQLADKDGLGGKISEDDKKTIQAVLKEAIDSG
jgi:endoplasmic reticulum chaperone BiP